MKLCMHIFLNFPSFSQCFQIQFLSRRKWIFKKWKGFLLLTSSFTKTSLCFLTAIIFGIYKGITGPYFSKFQEEKAQRQWMTWRPPHQIWVSIKFKIFFYFSFHFTNRISINKVSTNTVSCSKTWTTFFKKFIASNLNNNSYDMNNNNSIYKK